LLSLIPKETVWVEFGDGYYYLNEYAQLDQTGYPGDGIFYKGSPFIFPKIEEYKFNENYITAKQKYSKQNSSKLLKKILSDGVYNNGGWGKINTDIFPVYDSIMYDAFKKYYVTERTSMRVEAFCDSVIDNSPYFKVMEENDYNYYIIEKQDIVKHGPLSRNEFETKCIFLNLPSNLWIDE